MRHYDTEIHWSPIGDDDGFASPSTWWMITCFVDGYQVVNAGPVMGPPTSTWYEVAAALQTYWQMRGMKP